MEEEMKYLLILILPTSCAHTPQYEYRCPPVVWVDRGANRPIDEIDLTTLGNARKYCSEKKNINKCIVRIDRLPNYSYYGLCGYKRKYEVK